MSTVVRRSRAEWGRLYVAVRGPLFRRRWRALPMTLGVVCLTALIQFTQNRSWGYGFVQDVGAVRAEDPLWLALLRTPLSLFVPAPDLPVWGALAQILIVFGLAEICLGWWRTLTVAYVATLAGDALRARGHRRGPGGLPGAARHGRAHRGHRSVGGRGGPRRVPGVALPGVCDRGCGDRRDGGGGGSEGQPHAARSIWRPSWP